VEDKMPGITDPWTLLNSLKGNLTPGYNGQPNPMSQGQPTFGQPSNTTPSPSSGPTALANQGLLGKLGGLIQNPQFIQALAGLALSQGKQGGARGAGFMNQMALQQQQQLAQQKAAEEKRQFDAEIALRKQQVDQQGNIGNISSLADLMKIADVTGGTLTDLAPIVGLKADPVRLAKLDAGLEKRRNSAMVYMDENGNIDLEATAETPGMTGVPQKYAMATSKALQGKAKANEDSFYVINSKPIPKKEVEIALQDTGLTPSNIGAEGPMPMAQAITRLGQIIKSEPQQSVDRMQMDDWLKKHPGKGPSDYKMWEQSQTAANANRDSMIPVLDRVAISLANGDLTNIRDIASLRSDQRLLLYDKVKQLNPNFNTAEVNRKIKMIDWTENGKGADQIQSYNTFLVHAGQLNQVIKTAGLTNSQAMNKPLNWLREHVKDSPEYARLLVAIDPVQKEFQSFLLNNRALYQDDRITAQRQIGEDQTPNMIMAATSQMGHTAQARGNEINYRYKKVIGSDIEDMFSPEALEAAKVIGLRISNKGQTPTGPTTKRFSQSAWLKANPGGDINAATTEARNQGYEVIQ
jgi:hypothetical protein